MDAEQRTARTAALAHQIWEAEGRPDGQQQRHWQMAERLVLADIAAAHERDPEAGSGPS
ncbi:DUF2934 family protein [Stenotrophomonas maltophilia]|jgi:DUF2934 family protein|uniref:DUF2934 domain-containing protein n=1 Tax=Stenotrophomonas chelatiphaga TaxID=517011 RepID=UPI000F4B34A2|nr:DUF2934 domain-containing protein [Stenotrophomonas chelatiphaga]MCS4229489.1 hypothetical protein [Stenotrophomonas chelatiphaga]ROQ46062.1 DUF2934 family protein [Stenotrophomonas maltophilia]